MLVGHIAVALGAKRISPSPSLGMLVLAAMFADLLWAIFSIAGVEHAGAMPGVKLNRFFGDQIAYSHSLAMDVLWAALLAAVYFAWSRDARAAWLVAAAVASHWGLDVISHRPDMPLAPGVQTVLGFGLWNSLPATVIVEGGLWLLAIALYVRATRPRQRAGIYAFWPVIALLTLMGGANLFAAPPDDTVRGGIASLTFFSLIVAWACWMDTLRDPRGVPASAIPHGRASAAG